MIPTVSMKIRWRRLMVVICIIIQIPPYLYGSQSTSRDTLSKGGGLDSVNLNGYRKYQDSISASQNQFVKDSLKNLGDSIAKSWIGVANPNRVNRFTDSLMELYTVKNLDFVKWAEGFKKKSNHYNEGRLKPHGERWVLIMTLSLIFFLGFIKYVFPKEFSLLIEAFFNNRILGQLNKEDNILGSWPFIFMLFLFGLTAGLFLYISGIRYSHDGFQWFLILSILIISLFVIKILMLLLMGFFFQIEKLVKEYLSILYLSYFNTSIILLPLVSALCLAPSRFSSFYIYSTAIILGLIFLFQFIRAGTNILTTYRFPKVYLILYLCALEICPLLILIKALGV